MRNRFNEQLEQLNVELIKMGALCEEAISAATKALLDGDDALRESAAAAEREIDQKERDIENLCMKLLLQQQPVARDLRAISAALKMISDMERIGDQAADIAEITLDIAHSPMISRVPIAEMARNAIVMVTDSIDSFVRKNLSLAQAVVRRDDEVDQLFLDVKQELVRLLGQGDSGEVCIDLLMIAKYLERIGDHAMNIAECAKEIAEKNIVFSEEATRELNTMFAAVQEITYNAITAFTTGDLELAYRIEPLEELIDSLCDEMKLHHVDRLQKGVCTLSQGFVFNDLLTNYERVADHCSNIAVAMIELEADSFDTHEYLSSVKAMKSAAYERYYEEYRQQFAL